MYRYLYLDIFGVGTLYITIGSIGPGQMTVSAPDIFFLLFMFGVPPRCSTQCDCLLLFLGIVDLPQFECICYLIVFMVHYLKVCFRRVVQDCSKKGQCWGLF